MTSPDCRIRLLSEGDIDAALGLCRDAGWNQLAFDWLRLIRFQPTGCFAAVIDDNLVGTATTTSYGKDLAWIGMMLVDPKHQRRGIASELLRHSIDFLRNDGVESIKLDATPLGKTVYEHSGFQVESTFHRWRGRIDGPIDAARSETLDEERYVLDERAFGAGRRDFLNALAEESIVVTGPNAYGMLHPGYLATYLGPVVAADAGGAKEIILRLLKTVQGDVFWDVLDDNDAAVELARSLDFQIVRELTRMSIGPQRAAPEPTFQYAIAGPEVG